MAAESIRDPNMIRVTFGFAAESAKKLVADIKNIKFDANNIIKTIIGSTVNLFENIEMSTGVFVLLLSHAHKIAEIIKVFAVDSRADLPWSQKC